MDAGVVVYVITEYTGYSGDKIMYNGELYDNGDNFDTTSFEYTAPLTGQYIVTSNLYAGDHKSYQSMRINGVGVAHAYSYDDSVPWVTTEPTLVVHMNAGDKLSIVFEVEGGQTGIIGGCGANFDGFQTWLSVALIHTE